MLPTRTTGRVVAIEFASPGPARRPLIPQRGAPPTSAPGQPPTPAPAVAGLPAIPRPGPHLFTRKNPMPPALGEARDPDAIYLLDSGVAFAFGHADRTALLHDHYGTQLRYVDDVMVEIRSRRRSKPKPPPAGADPERLAKYQRNLAIKNASIGLVRDLPRLFGDPIALTYEDQTHIETLVAELCRLQGAQPSGAKHRGECATVHYGKSFAPSNVNVVVICANDDGARLLAANHTIGHRNMHTVLREMVRDGHLTKQEAWDLYELASQVTQLPAHARPRGADDF